MTHQDLADAAVRQAVRAAIDRRRLVRTVEHGYGLVTDSIVWPGAPVLHDDATIDPSPTKARTLLSADGWQPGANGTRYKRGRPLVLALVYQSGASDLDSLVEVMRAELQAVGVTLVTRTYQHDLLFAQQGEGGILATGKFDIALYASTLVSIPDLTSNFDCAQAPPHGENYNRWCDPVVNALLPHMRTSYDARTVTGTFAKINRRFIDDVPSIQLFVWKGSYVMSEHLRGYHPNAITSFDDMMNVDI